VLIAQAIVVAVEVDEVGYSIEIAVLRIAGRLPNLGRVVYAVAIRVGVLIVAEAVRIDIESAFDFCGDSVTVGVGPTAR
jgi:hypothetical protein